MTLVSQIPKGLWMALLHEMKKYKTFRDGYQQGKNTLMKSHYLTPESDSSYRHKFGVLVACFEAGEVTDIVLDRSSLSVIAFRGKEQVYKFTQN